MNIIGLLRVRNEARWIAEVLHSIEPLCDRVLVLDDHSTDETAPICAAEGTTVLPSPFVGLDEARDKNWLLDQARKLEPDWAVMIDGDEVLESGGAELIRQAIDSQTAPAFSLRIMYLWNDRATVRVDGVYGAFRRPSVFRVLPGQRFAATGNGGNFHCSSIPRELFRSVRACEARLLHLGYMRAEDRLRKWAWYQKHDPGNAVEDFYRHMVQGDVPEIPTGVKLRHAGPLRTEPFIPAASDISALCRT